MRRMTVLAMLMVLLATACSDTSGTTSLPDPTAAPTDSTGATDPGSSTSRPPDAAEDITASPEEVLVPSDSPVFEPGNIEPALQPFVDLATADLAERLAVRPGDITLVSAVLVVWPDRSHGCPVPGIEYLQVPEDGSLIELEVGGAFYRYHTGGQQFTPFLCDQPLKERPPTGDIGGIDN